MVLKSKRNFAEYQRIRSVVHDDCCMWDSEEKRCVSTNEMCGRCRFYKTEEQYKLQTGMTYAEGMRQAQKYYKEGE